MKPRRKNVTITLPAGLWDKVGRYSDDNDLAKSGVVESALKLMFEEERKRRLKDAQYEGMARIETSKY